MTFDSSAFIHNIINIGRTSKSIKYLIMNLLPTMLCFGTITMLQLINQSFAIQNNVSRFMIAIFCYWN